MLIGNIFLISFALSLDAFGLALGIGCGKKSKLYEKFSLTFSFGFFQGFLAFLGAILGGFISQYFFNISGYLSGIIIIIIGVLFIKEGLENTEECLYLNLTLWTFITLGVSVSIDALGVGFSLLYQYSFMAIFINTLVIGVITSIMTGISFLLVGHIKKIILVEKYSDYIGGVILIILGLKMVITG
ncbi:MAG: manganese efflux pump MntP family protein [Fusobacteriota bacterium]